MSKLYDLLTRQSDDALIPPPHVHFWVVGYKGRWRIVTVDSWHLLYKHGRPKKLRPARKL